SRRLVLDPIDPGGGAPVALRPEERPQRAIQQSFSGDLEPVDGPLVIQFEQNRASVRERHIPVLDAQHRKCQCSFLDKVNRLIPAQTRESVQTHACPRVVRYKLPAGPETVENLPHTASFRIDIGKYVSEGSTPPVVDDIFSRRNFPYRTDDCRFVVQKN